MAYAMTYGAKPSRTTNNHLIDDVTNILIN